MIKKLLTYSLIMLQCSYTLNAQPGFKHWPKGKSPQEIGLRLTQQFLSAPHGKYGGNVKPHIPYFEVCNWYGALSFVKQTNNDTLKKKLIARFDNVVENETDLLPYPDHVDYNVFGVLPLEIYLQTKNEKYFTQGKMYADTQWAAPFGPRVNDVAVNYYNKGYSFQTRLWIDDMYMINLLQCQAYRVTKNKNYINRAAKEMVLYLDSLQKPNGLFYHAPSAPFFWGRGNGWMAAGMTEILKVLDKNNPYHKQIMQGYKNMMESLLQYQATDGMWRQLVNDTSSWKETSCTGMFAYAMITGVKNSRLNKKQFAPAAKKAWLALTGYINYKGEISDVCEGTGAGNTKQYYLDRKKITGDYHGQAPVLWCASALLR
ncbi:glycoside hydrolase family 88/105 protein [Ferruginibacter sp.]|nr:glycoside hydrolase family 88 protein [Ferruginibacter sp.]